MGGSEQGRNARQNGGMRYGGTGWLWLGVLLVFALFWMGGQFREQGQQISYTAFKQAVSAGRVERVTFSGSDIDGVYKATRQEGEGEKHFFSSRLPPTGDGELLGLLERKGVAVSAVAESSGWTQALLLMLPWVLILGFMVFAARRVQSAGGTGAGGLFNVGRSKAKRFRKDRVRVTFDDVAGAENAKRDMRQIVEYLLDPHTYLRLGAKIPKGVLLMGPPGTGKTLLAKAVAGEADVPFYSISGSEFIEMFVGVGAARVRDMFANARRESPAIIFVDEIDSVGRARGAGVGGGHDEREQTLNQILGEMDGFEPHETVVVLAATNRPDVLDPALTRPGRFDRKVVLELPHRDARRRILEVHTRRVPLAADVDLGQLASKTVGMSGADLENLVNEAALLAGRDKKDKVDRSCFDRARDKIVLGSEREGVIGEEEKRLIAYHEAGHALAARLLPKTDPLEKVTIIPRGQSLGATEQMPDEDRHHNLAQSYLEARIAVMLAGRVAEQVTMGEASTGAESDLKQATRVARRMVSNWGMSERLGAMVFRQSEDHVFLGRELAQPRDFSDYTARVIDQEVREIIERAERRVRRLFTEHRDQLERLAQALLEKETLYADEIARLLDGARTAMAPARYSGAGAETRRSKA